MPLPRRSLILVVHSIAVTALVTNMTVSRVLTCSPKLYSLYKQQLTLFPLPPGSINYASGVPFILSMHADTLSAEFITYECFICFSELYHRMMITLLNTRQQTEGVTTVDNKRPTDQSIHISIDKFCNKKFCQYCCFPF